MVEQDPGDGVHAEGFAIAPGYGMPVRLGDAVRAARVKARRFALGEVSTLPNISDEEAW